jgi:hypothetical protein
MQRGKLSVVDGDALDLDLFAALLGPHEISVRDEEADGVGISIEYLAEDERSGFALFVNCRPLLRSEETEDLETSLRAQLEGKREMGHEAEGLIRIVAGLPACCTGSHIEDQHEADLIIKDAGRLFHAHATSTDSTLTRAAMDLVEERLLPQFLAPA